MEIRFPDALHVLDAGHPDCLDWRQVTFSIDQHLQNMHLCFRLRRKAGGRRPQDVAACQQFRAELDRIVEQFYRQIDESFDARDEGPLNPLFRMTGSHGFSDNGSRSPSITFGFNGEALPNFMLMSNHKLMQARSILSDIAQHTKARRDRTIRL